MSQTIYSLDESGQWSFMNASRSMYQAIGARPSSRPFFRSFESKATVRTDTPLRQHRARTPPAAPPPPPPPPPPLPPSPSLLRRAYFRGGGRGRRKGWKRTCEGDRTRYQVGRRRAKRLRERVVLYAGGGEAARETCARKRREAARWLWEEELARGREKREEAGERGGRECLGNAWCTRSPPPPMCTCARVCRVYVHAVG